MVRSRGKGDASKGRGEPSRGRGKGTQPLGVQKKAPTKKKPRGEVRPESLQNQAFISCLGKPPRVTNEGTTRGLVPTITIP